jgi:hypothetical protein
MKLAEALVARADAQNRLNDLRRRLAANARVQEGDPPVEDPAALLEEFERTSNELLMLIQRINRTNSKSPFGSATLTEALAERDVLKLRQALYRDLAQAASASQSRTTRSEVKFVSTVSVSEIQRAADRLAKEHRELDTRIQEANWTVALVD